MSPHQLEIIMKLKDELSKRLTGIEGNLLRFGNRVKEMGASLRSAAKMIGQVGQTMVLFGGIITGPLVLAFREADKYSGAVHNQLEKLKNLTAAFQVQIATALIPLMEKFINTLGGLFNAWNSLGPATQQMIIQGVALTGVFLALGGGALILIRHLGNLFGIIQQAAGSFLVFVALNPVLAAIIGSVAILVVLMIKFKGVADVVLNGVELSLLTLLNGFEALKVGILKALALIQGGIEKVLTWLAKIPGPQQEMFKNMAAGAAGAREELDKLAEKGLGNIIKNSEKMGKILSGGQGSLAEGFDNVKDKVSGLWDKLKNPPPFNIKPIAERLKSLQEISDDIFKAMERGMSDLFYNSVMEKSFKLQNFFQQLGQSILRIWTDLMAQMVTNWLRTMTTMQSGSGGSSAMSWLGILGKAIGIGAGIGGIVGGVGGSIVSTGGQSIAGHVAYNAWSPSASSLAAMGYHNGGPILDKLVRAHNGLAVGEVPIIAKRGEYVLSERGVAAAGGIGNLNRINRGEQSGGGSVVHNHFNIQAQDAESFLRYKPQIIAVVTEAMKKNTSYTDTVRKYGR